VTRGDVTRAEEEGREHEHIRATHLIRVMRAQIFVGQQHAQRNQSALGASVNRTTCDLASDGVAHKVAEEPMLPF
jgi:hypothetical protein